MKYLLVILLALSACADSVDPNAPDQWDGLYTFNLDGALIKGELRATPESFLLLGYSFHSVVYSGSRVSVRDTSYYGAEKTIMVGEFNRAAKHVNGYIVSKYYTNGSLQLSTTQIISGDR
jgi:hypothetical protein